MFESSKQRGIAFAVISTCCVLFAVGYALHAARRTTVAVDGVNLHFVEDPVGWSRVTSGDYVAFRTTAVAEAHGRLVAAPLTDPAGVRYLSNYECERVDVGGGIGVCLTADRGFIATYGALIFDGSLNARHRLTLTGIPSRTRVSPDGKLAAVTTFVSGHSYAGGSFSTRTVLIDTESGRELNELEQFTVTENGRVIRAVDFNFWGVTFAPDSNRFYGTLATAGRLLLIEGDARAATARVLRDGVECPSISPDGERLAFKKRTFPEGQLVWRIAVLDLASMQDHILAGETRSIDDQVEWLDDDTILYSASDEERGLGGTSVWAVRSDGSAPQKFLRGAFSPTVVRVERLANAGSAPN